MPSPTSSETSSSVADTGYTTIDALLGGAKWGGGAGSGVSLTYSFPSGTAYHDPFYSSDGEWYSWSPLNATQITQARAALQTWANVANVSFFETSDTDSNVGDLRFARFSGGSDESAHAYYPGDYPAAGDIWIDYNDSSNTSPTPGTFGYLTLLHEIGHALGLKHPFESSPTLSSAQDNTNYTVMTYTQLSNPVTPMLYDILAIQYLYGANMSFRSGNDSYTLGGTASQTLWDAGGNDTITMSGSGTLDLRQGQLFNIGGVNYAIAFNAQIENGIGSASGDTIRGNELANLLYGQDGNDQVLGNEGDDYLSGGNNDDTLDGGPGNDTMNGGSGNDAYIIDSGGDIIQADAGGTDTVQTYIPHVLSADLENVTLLGSAFYAVGNASANLLSGTDFDNYLYGMAGIDTLNGNGGSDTIFGGDGNDTVNGGIGNDVLLGEAGADTLTGGDGDDAIDGGTGNDIMSGNAGNDTYLVDSTSDVINEASGTDTVQTYVPWVLASGLENLTLLGSASFGAGNSASNVVTGNGASNTLLRGDGGNDSIYGGGGNDWIEGDHSGNGSLTGNDYLQGDDGDDTVLGGPGDDTVHGNAGTDTIVGEGGNDVMYGDAAIDYIDGRQGGDQLFGGDGNDIIFGDGLTTTYGFAGDTIRGEAGDDILMGESGDHAAGGALDVIYGDAGNDQVYGGAGNDWIFGGDGADVIDGGPGSDFIVGGAGPDIMLGSGASAYSAATSGGDLFSYAGLGDGGDSIYGFDLSFASGNDGIDLHSIFDAIGYTGTTPRSAGPGHGYLYVFQNGVNTNVYVDATGNANGVQLTHLVMLANITATSLTDSYFLFQ